MGRANQKKLNLWRILIIKKDKTLNTKNNEEGKWMIDEIKIIFSGG